MLVSATRAASAWVLRALLYVALFAVVAVAHVAITTALRKAGWSGGPSLFVSGAVLLAFVLACVQFAEFVRTRLAAWRERRRARQGLPSGPCCVIWRGGAGEGDEMPWEMIGAPRARYPRLARTLGVEGVAVVDFEVNAEGAAKNVHCVDAWPSDVFFEAAREAMRHVRFRLRGDVHPRFGASYRMPFVFRIAGAAKLRETGRRAKPLRPALRAAAQAMEKLRGNA